MTCTVTLDQARSVTATFSSIPRALSVTKAGSGSGTVASALAGIDCGTDCTEDYDNGATVTLTANPASGSTFTGFTGAGCSGAAATCTVAMSEARSVTATFGLVPPTPTSTATPTPTPTPTLPARGKGKLSAKVTRADLRAPFRFTTSGWLMLPSGLARSVGCRGRVSVQVKRGSTTISTLRVSLRSDCTYSSRVSFANARRFAGAKTLKFTARFLGNARVSPVAATPRFGRVRR